MFGSIAAHSRAGLNVVAGAGLYDPAVNVRCRAVFDGLPALWVGVRCPIDVIMERRNAAQVGREGEYATGTPHDPVPAPVMRWQNEIHRHMSCDLDVDTSCATPRGVRVVDRERARARADHVTRNATADDAGRVH